MPSNEFHAPKSKKGIRVLIVDDSDQVRNELQRWLNLFENVIVVGETSNGRTAIRLSEALHPDVVLLDLEMPVLDGWETTRELKRRQLTDWVVVLTIHTDDVSHHRAMKAGADEIVPKTSSLNEILQAIMRCPFTDDKEEGCQ